MDNNNLNYEQSNNHPIYDGPSFSPSNVKIPTVGDWIITIILIAIPLVNIIMLLIWSFSSETNPVKKNFAKAQLILMLIGIIISILFASCTSTALLSSF